MNIQIKKVIPVATFNGREDAVENLSLLSEGGLKNIEITFRTEYAAQAIKLAVNEFPDIVVGAGTIVNSNQCEQALDAGAKFIVGPGFSEDIAKICIRNDVLYVPGVVTPTEIMKATALGLKLLKYFPFAPFGGSAAVKALSGPFPDVKFILTNGITNENFTDLITIENVFGVGGSWMLKGSREEKLEKIKTIASKI